APIAVDPIDQGGQSRALAATGRAGYKHEAAAKARPLLNRLRDPEPFERGNLVRNNPKGDSHVAALAVGVAADSSLVPPCEREVEFAIAWTERLSALACKDARE